MYAQLDTYPFHRATINKRFESLRPVLLTGRAFSTKIPKNNVCMYAYGVFIFYLLLFRYRDFQVFRFGEYIISSAAFIDSLPAYVDHYFYHLSSTKPYASSTTISKASPFPSCTRHLMESSFHSHKRLAWRSSTTKNAITCTFHEQN
ncbi:unnamed protein product [Ectocarpus sp. 4 AP-2014]